MHPRVLTNGAVLTAAILLYSGCGSSAPSKAPPAGTSSGAPSFTLAVTNLDDAGPGSLRAAIAAANAQPPGTPCVITFSVSGIIVLASALPAIDAKTKIDGTSAPGYAGTSPVVEIDARRNPGLVFASGSSDSQLLALAVDNASGSGVTLDASAITLNLNYIGLDLAGAAYGNGGDGVVILASSADDRIGLNASGASGAVANVISANAGNGISLHAASETTISANRIGTNPAGTAAIPNGANGIWLTDRSRGNEIGGVLFTDSATGAVNDPTGDKGTAAPVFVVPPLGNLISGNASAGVLIDDYSTGNILNGNFIGTTAGGDAALGNGGDGVAIDGAPANALIGCQFVNNPFVYYNVVSGNGGNGLHVTNADGVVVQGNFFGAGANNATVVANRGDGILIDGSSHGTLVGGVIPLGNVASGNARNGIEVADAASSFTTFNTFGGLFAFGGAAPNGNDGVLITATGGNQLARTNVLSGNAHNGLEIGGNASGVTVDPNIIGLNTVGIKLLPNGGDGVLIDGTAHGNAIGGSYVSVIPQNTFSGNKGYGVAMTGRAYENQLFGSYIGTNVLGAGALGNQLGGVYVGGQATNDEIGEGNIVSANGGYGVTLDAGTSSIDVIGNVIGLSRALTSLPNASGAIFVNPGSTSDTISANVTTP